MTTEEEIQTDGRIEVLSKEAVELSRIHKYIKSKRLQVNNEILELKGMG